MHTTYYIDDISTLPEILWRQAKGIKIWTFHGDMGVGKTTLIRAIASYLQIGELVCSPTFAMVHEYTSAQIGGVYHFDWYRLHHIEDIVSIGTMDMLRSGFYCWIEWPERAMELIPFPYFSIQLEHINQTKRGIITKVVLC